MILTDHEIRQAAERAKTAFPNFTDWEYNNEKNEYYSGFSLWGEYSPDPEDLMSKHFYITFDIYEDKWTGCLTIGQPSYFWSSADVGDAHLVATQPCETLEEAITALKTETANLFRAFSAI